MLTDDGYKCDTCKLGYNHDLIVEVLGEIVVILEATIVELKLVVTADLILAGVACTVAELAAIIGAILVVSFIFCSFCGLKI